ncbi:hypothetical protein ACOME3_009243 [Neoechinorhynchus agilis]
MKIDQEGAIIALHLLTTLFLQVLTTVGCSASFQEYSSPTAIRQTVDDLLNRLKNNDNDFATLYSLAAAYLALNDNRSAKNALLKVVRIKPEFHAARLRLAEIEIKQGLFKSLILPFKSKVVIQIASTTFLVFFK